MNKLTQDSLTAYFSLPDESRSSVLIGKNLLDFVSRNSNKLVITIGDSWTWGADLTLTKNYGLHLSRLIDDEYRIRNVFGNVLSEKLNADFLNLGESGTSNHIVALKLDEVANAIELFDYDEILIVCTFTEVGRGFDSIYDRHIDYNQWTTNAIKEPSDYYQLLVYINEQIATKIYATIQKLERISSKKITIKCGTNFVEQTGFESLTRYFLPNSWLSVWCESQSIPYSSNCYFVSDWILTNMRKSLMSMSSKFDDSLFKTWAIEVLDVANKRALLCTSDKVNFGQLLHPMPIVHKAWADYIAGEL